MMPEIVRCVSIPEFYLFDVQTNRYLLRTISFIVLISILCIPTVLAINLTPGNSGMAVIAQGDPVTISGVATGQPQVGLQIWLIGYNYAKVTTIQVNSDDSYAYNLKKADTVNLAPGEYFVLVQHPMMNQRFDIIYDPSSGSVKNVQTGKSIFQLTGSGSLQSTDAVSALMSAIASQNIDDTFAITSFYLSAPAVTIDPIGDQQVGTNVTINGTTTLAVGDTLKIDVVSSSFTPSGKTNSSGFSGVLGMVTVVSGTGSANNWSIGIDTSTFTPDNYIITVSGVDEQVTASSNFNVECAGSGDTCSIPGLSSSSTQAVPGAPTMTSSTPESTQTVPAPIAQPTTNAIPAPITTRSPIPLEISILGIAATMVLWRKK